MEETSLYQIFFFRHLQHHNRYFVKIFREDRALEYYKSVRHINDYTSKSGYEFLEIGAPFVAIEINDSDTSQRFIKFFKEKLAVRIADENPAVEDWIGNNGWFEIDEIAPEKWLEAFNESKNIKNQELPKANRVGNQTTLF